MNRYTSLDLVFYKLGELGVSLFYGMTESVCHALEYKAAHTGEYGYCEAGGYTSWSHTPDNVGESSLFDACLNDIEFLEQVLGYVNNR